MIENVIRIQIEKNGRSYSFYCNSDSSLGEVHDVLFQMKEEVIKKINSLDVPKEVVNG